MYMHPTAYQKDGNRQWTTIQFERLRKPHKIRRIPTPQDNTIAPQSKWRSQTIYADTEQNSTDSSSARQRKTGKTKHDS